MDNNEDWQYELEHHMNDILYREEGYSISYLYGDGGATVYIKRVSGHVDAKRAALYCEFKCEEWFGADKMLTNLGIGSLLVTFYGFQHHSAGPYDEIDMYRDRSLYGGNEYDQLMSDNTLYRENLREYMRPHVIG